MNWYTKFTNDLSHAGIYEAQTQITTHKVITRTGNGIRLVHDYECLGGDDMSIIRESFLFTIDEYSMKRLSKDQFWDIVFGCLVPDFDFYESL